MSSDRCCSLSVPQIQELSPARKSSSSHQHTETRRPASDPHSPKPNSCLISCESSRLHLKFTDTVVQRSPAPSHGGHNTHIANDLNHRCLKRKVLRIELTEQLSHIIINPGTLPMSHIPRFKRWILNIREYVLLVQETYITASLPFY